MTVGELIESNADFIFKSVGDNWGYDGLMEWYIKDKDKDLGEITSPRGLISHKTSQKAAKARLGNDYRSYTFEYISMDGFNDSSDWLDEIRGGYSNHHDFLMEESILNFLEGDSSMAYVLRKYVEGWSVKEIAESMNTPADTVRVYLTRNRNKMKKILNLNIKTHKQNKGKGWKRPDLAIRNKKR